MFDYSAWFCIRLRPLAIFPFAFRHGPAPTGNSAVGKMTKDSVPVVRTRPGPGKSAIPLPGGGSMPLLALSAEGSKEVVSAALQAGYRHFDCSQENLNQVRRSRLFKLVRIGL